MDEIRDAGGFIVLILFLIVNAINQHTHQQIATLTIHQQHLQKAQGQDPLQ